MNNLKSKFSILNENNTHSGGHKRPWVNYMIALAFFEEIKKSLEKHAGKRKLAAEELGISERTLYRKIKQFDL